VRSLLGAECSHEIRGDRVTPFGQKHAPVIAGAHNSFHHRTAVERVIATATKR
jgi:hypothetical protein